MSSNPVVFLPPVDYFNPCEWKGRPFSLLGVSIFLTTVFLSSSEHNKEQYRIFSSGEIGIRFLQGSCEVTSILMRLILYQHRVALISMENEDLNLKRRHY